MTTLEEGLSWSVVVVLSSRHRVSTIMFDVKAPTVANVSTRKIRHYPYCYGYQSGVIY